MAKNGLIAKNLCVYYDNTLILDNLKLAVKPNEFVAIVGQSGCGKTTLLNAIAGFISYKGHIKKPKKIGIVFQNHAVFPWLTIYENIAFSDKAHNKILHYIKMIDLLDKKDRYPFELSGGQRQRVALARTLASRPDLILMDEPYGALDIYNREKMQQWLLKIWAKEKKTILFVTHSIEEAIYLADRVIVMKNKKIIQKIKVNILRPRKSDIKFTKEFVNLKKHIASLI